MARTGDDAGQSVGISSASSVEGKRADGRSTADALSPSVPASEGSCWSSPSRSSCHFFFFGAASCGFFLNIAPDRMVPDDYWLDRSAGSAERSVKIKLTTESNAAPIWVFAAPMY